jgi:hypothetical protein
MSIIATAILLTISTAMDSANAANKRDPTKVEAPPAHASNNTPAQATHNSDDIDDTLDEIDNVLEEVSIEVCCFSILILEG